MILVMTVEPGYGGQELIVKTLEKIKDIREYIDKNNLECFIEADGGINTKTIKSIVDAGVDIAVVGSAITKSDNYAEAISQLKQF